MSLKMMIECKKNTIFLLYIWLYDHASSFSLMKYIGLTAFNKTVHCICRSDIVINLGAWSWIRGLDSSRTTTMSVLPGRTSITRSCNFQHCHTLNFGCCLLRTMKKDFNQTMLIHFTKEDFKQSDIRYYIVNVASELLCRDCQAYCGFMANMAFVTLSWFLIYYMIDTHIYVLVKGM